MQVLARFEYLPKPRDQSFVDGVELVRCRRQKASFSHLLKPEPLERGGLVERGRRVGVVLEQLRRARAVVGKIKPAVEGGLARTPARGDEVTKSVGNAQSG